MIFSEDIKVRMISMLDYAMARSAEFGGVNIEIRAAKIEGKMLYKVFIGTPDDGAEMFFDSKDSARWLNLWKGKESEWRRV